jgi:hypothetical protein
MRIPLILGVCIVACGAMVAQADLVTYYETGTDAPLLGTLSYTRTSYDSSLDYIDIHFSSPVMYKGNPVKGQFLEGTWSVLQGVGYMYVMSGAVPYSTTNGLALGDDLYTPPAPDSYVNYDAYWSASGFARTLKGDGNNKHVTALRGGWLTTNNGVYDPTQGFTPPDARLSNVPNTDPALFGMDTTLLARIYLSKDAGVSFSGTAGWGGWGFSDSANLHGGFSIPVPEPSMLFLAATGLVGLLCYAWRKRRS